MKNLLFILPFVIMTSMSCANKSDSQTWIVNPDTIVLDSAVVDTIGYETADTTIALNKVF